jgi:hypothetical protein
MAKHAISPINEYGTCFGCGGQGVALSSAGRARPQGYYIPVSAEVVEVPGDSSGLLRLASRARVVAKGQGLCDAKDASILKVARCLSDGSDGVPHGQKLVEGGEKSAEPSLHISNSQSVTVDKIMS